MSATAVATCARGSDPAALAGQTVEQLAAALGAQPVRAGVLYASGIASVGMARALSELLPGVAVMGATTLDAGPSLSGFWLAGDVRAVVSQRLRPEQGGRALAEAAVARAGLRAFQTRLAILHATQGEALLGPLFEVLPKGAAFVGTDVAEVWTEEGLAQDALLVADWQSQLAVGFEGAAQALAGQGLPPESCVGILRLRTGPGEQTPAELAHVPQTHALVRAVYGVPGRSPQAPATATLAFSNLKARAEV